MMIRNNKKFKIWARAINGQLIRELWLHLSLCLFLEHAQSPPSHLLLKKATTQQVANQHVKRHRLVVIVNGFWIKIVIRFHFSLFRLANIKMFSLFPGWLERGRKGRLHIQWMGGRHVGALSVTSGQQFNHIVGDLQCAWHLTQRFQVRERVLGWFSWPCCYQHVWGAHGSSIVIWKNPQQDHKWPSAGVWLHNFWFIH